MEIPLTPAGQDLLKYYKQRIERAEHDYRDALDALEKIKISHKDYHEISWELHQRTNEIASLQKALGDAQTYLFDERKQLLKALAENDELRIQELKDRKKIRYLLAMYGLPDQEETTYFKQELEQRFVKRAPSALGQAAGVADIIDYEDVESLRLRCKALTAQLDEQSRVYEETIAALKQDKELSNEEFDMRHRHDKKAIEDLLRKVEKLQDFCRENTKEVLEMKKAGQISERRNKEERARLYDEVNTMKLQYGRDKPSIGVPAENAEVKFEERTSRKNEIIMSEMKRNLAKFEGMVDDERARREQLETSHQRTVNILKGRLEAAHNECKLLAKRRQNEVEGLNSDIDFLKKEVRKLETDLVKVLPSDDRERDYLRIGM
eukprot:Partr_v1_DN27025_c1_g1_i4_m28739 putative Coiled-coil domain containing 77